MFDDVTGKDDLLAWTCIRRDRRKSGYRFVHLFDAKEQECTADLLVKIEQELR